MEATENRIKTLEKRMEKAENKITEIEKNVIELDKNVTTVQLASQKDIHQIFQSLEKIEKNTEKINKEVEEIKYKPAKKWDSIVGTIITVIVSTIVGYFLAKGGL